MTTPTHTCSFSSCKANLTAKYESAKAHIGGKYHSFVDWTAKNSYDVRGKLAKADTDCVVRRTAKLALTMLATFFLAPFAAINTGFKWAKEVCWKKPVAGATAGTGTGSNSNPV